MFTRCYSKKIVIKILLYSCVFFHFFAAAAVLDISAHYKLDSDEISGGRFVNTTPCYMGHNVPYCNPSRPLESETIVKLPVQISRTMKSTQGRLNFMSYFRLSGQKKVVLTNNKTGEQHELLFIPVGIGANITNMRYPYTEITNNFKPMRNIDGDCFNNYETMSVWYPAAKLVTEQLFYYSIKSSSKESFSECYLNDPAGDNTSYIVEWLNYGFKIKSPMPLSMSSGVYTGSLKILVGRNQDIDLGEGVYLSGIEHELKFTLTVNHKLRVVFPTANGFKYSNVTLLPIRGWSEWNHNRKEQLSVLQQDLPLRIWSSVPFTISLRCQYLAGIECALKNKNGHQVSLNSYYVDRLNEINLLSTTPHSFKLSDKALSIENEARAIRFSVAVEAVKEMLKYPGSTYKGDVTLIFDVSIN